MITRRLINCDFFTKGNISTKCSNKAKLIYFYFFVNADDVGFVGNGREIAETLDRCEENYENTLFQFSYVDSIEELVKANLLIDFKDSCGNHIYLIRHWFLHNKKLDFVTTNYNSLFAQVEIVNGKYNLRNNKEEKPLKEKEIKENTNKNNSNLKSNSLKDYDNEFDDKKNIDNKDEHWEQLLKDIGV